MAVSPRFRAEDIEPSNAQNPEYQLWCAVLMCWVRDLVSIDKVLRENAYTDMFGLDTTVRSITHMLGWPSAQHKEFVRRCRRLYKAAQIPQNQHLYHPVNKIRAMA
jgi:hypothetical protein